jgi:hypothetical protein
VGQSGTLGQLGVSLRKCTAFRVPLPLECPSRVGQAGYVTLHATLFCAALLLRHAGDRGFHPLVEALEAVAAGAPSLDAPLLPPPEPEPAQR